MRFHWLLVCMVCVLCLRSLLCLLQSFLDTWVRLLHLLYDIEVMWQKTIKHTFSMFYMYSTP